MSHCEEIEKLDEKEDTAIKKKKIKDQLTLSHHQFKVERINSKVHHVISKYHNTLAPNVYQQRSGVTLTPLMEGKVQYHKMKKEHNIIAVREELCALGVPFLPSTNWRTLIKLLKENEQGSDDADESASKYFKL
eukprot:1244250-Ditylum_brightwellii.AAC.1